MNDSLCPSHATLQVMRNKIAGLLQDAEISRGGRGGGGGGGGGGRGAGGGRGGGSRGGGRY